MKATLARVAATGSASDDDGVRLPTGEVHAWEPGTNQTLCGVPLHRAQLQRFSHVSFADALPETGGAADFVASVCRRCRAATRGSHGTTDPGGAPTRVPERLVQIQVNNAHRLNYAQ
jgi:hypothetical protein